MPVAGLWLSASAASGLSRTASLEVKWHTYGTQEWKKAFTSVGKRQRTTQERRTANILNGYRQFFQSVGRRFEPDGAH